MPRQIFIIYASIVDANGTWNALNGYPKKFDSKDYDNDVDKTLMRAKGEYHDTLGPMFRRDDRQLQTVQLVTANGMVVLSQSIGALANLPVSEE